MMIIYVDYKKNIFSFLKIEWKKEEENIILKMAGNLSI